MTFILSKYDVFVFLQNEFFIASINKDEQYYAIWHWFKGSEGKSGDLILSLSLSLSLYGNRQYNETNNMKCLINHEK